MIEQYFPAPAPVHKKYWPGTVFHNPTPVLPELTGEAKRAAARGLSTEEYRARVALVMADQTSVNFQIGDTVWPIYPKDVKRYGACIITAFCRHYDDYGEADWNDPPFLLSVSPLSDRTISVQCSVTWVTRTRPEIAGEIINEC